MYGNLEKLARISLCNSSLFPTGCFAHPSRFRSRADVQHLFTSRARWLSSSKVKRLIFLLQRTERRICTRPRITGRIFRAGRNGAERRSLMRRFTNWREDSRRRNTCRARNERTWRGDWSWPRPRSRSGFKTDGTIKTILFLSSF